MTLEDFFSEHNKVAIGFSGGVDSSYLLYEAIRCGAKVGVYYVSTVFQPAFEREDALRLAVSLGVTPTILEPDILSCEEVAANPPDRCYHCKKQIFGAIAAKAQEDGYTVLLDGTNASDDAGDRPGMRALGELNILSPLRLCGIAKAQVRSYSREAGLFTWDKPAYACLATRIPTGEEITPEKLIAVEKAESFLMTLGFTDFRVRTAGGHARIQLPGNQTWHLLKNKDKVLAELKPLFKSVSLDLEERS